MLDILLVILLVDCNELTKIDLFVKDNKWSGDRQWDTSDNETHQTFKAYLKVPISAKKPTNRIELR